MTQSYQTKKLTYFVFYHKYIELESDKNNAVIHWVLFWRWRTVQVRHIGNVLLLQFVKKSSYRRKTGYISELLRC